MAEGEETCRICLETSSLGPVSTSKLSESLIPDEDRLISPCACSGTQAFVHFKCLRKWQTAVMSSRRPSANLSPALICSVCTQKFSVAPLRPALVVRIWKSLTNYSYEVAGLCIVLCACYLALAGHNLHSLLEELGSGLMLAREVFPCSFQFTALEDKCSSRTCSLIGSRWGSGRLNLQPGTLLVATPAMPSPFFFGSVVLLYEHKRCSGSRGLVLNMQSEEQRISEWEKKMAPAISNPSVLGRIAHGTGGPLAQHDWMMLNRCACCGSLSSKDSPCSSQIEGDGKLYSKDWGQELLPGVFLGRDVSPVFVRSKEEPAIFSHQVLHGHAEWFVGQLWSEVKRGLWVTKQNASEILLSTPPHELWHVLIRE
ncbi:hypothetical protein KP509_06G026800 [Ceratopteris richardii]|uniref:RING-CH-type domain-containing protein n=1 Tax=Ceratopteris richardii TaxID=49495 RepID=A0A8T2UR11_CERRI|nr:hypothetical protein KP509_06G026800 [Ceratopteris richardii]KAH7434629.1 hypothetical protein KP509_06G026800 [Ceratopteris richardii]KAH7434630.1 hypothetical protein KP509_06G026800 [Ceratopteris richardii]